MRLSIFDLVRSDWLQDVYKTQSHAFDAMMKISSDDIIGVFHSYIFCMSELNNYDFAKYVRNLGLWVDCFGFYNSRAAIIVSGKVEYEKVISGDFNFNADFLRFADPICRLEDGVRSSMICAYAAKTGRNLMHDVDFFSDELFVATIRNTVFDEDFQKAMDGDYSIAMGGDLLAEVSVDGLGVVRRGEFLVHQKFGIAWLYLIARDRLGNVKIFALFKDSMRNLLLSDGVGWRRCGIDRG